MAEFLSREKMHQFHSENLQKEDTIKDLEYKLSQITNENENLTQLVANFEHKRPKLLFK